MKQNRHAFLATSAVAVPSLTGGAALFGAPLQAAAADADPGPPLQNFGSYAAPTTVAEIEIVNLRELEPAAQRVIPPGGFGYIASAAGDEWTKHENELAYK